MQRWAGQTMTEASGADNVAVPVRGRPYPTAMGRGDAGGHPRAPPTLTARPTGTNPTAPTAERARRRSGGHPHAPSPPSNKTPKQTKRSGTAQTLVSHHHLAPATPPAAHIFPSTTLPSSPPSPKSRVHRPHSRQRVEPLEGPPQARPQPQPRQAPRVQPQVGRPVEPRRRRQPRGGPPSPLQARTARERHRHLPPVGRRVGNEVEEPPHAPAGGELHERGPEVVCPRHVPHLVGKEGEVPLAPRHTVGDKAEAFAHGRIEEARARRRRRRGRRRRPRVAARRPRARQHGHPRARHGEDEGGAADEHIVAAHGGEARLHLCLTLAIRRQRGDGVGFGVGGPLGAVKDEVGADADKAAAGHGDRLGGGGHVFHHTAAKGRRVRARAVGAPVAAGDGAVEHRRGGHVNDQPPQRHVVPRVQRVPRARGGREGGRGGGRVQRRVDGARQRRGAGGKEGGGAELPRRPNDEEGARVVPNGGGRHGRRHGGVQVGRGQRGGRGTRSLLPGRGTIWGERPSETQMQHTRGEGWASGGASARDEGGVGEAAGGAPGKVPALESTAAVAEKPRLGTKQHVRQRRTEGRSSKLRRHVPLAAGKAARPANKRRRRWRRRVVAPRGRVGPPRSRPTEPP
ncbi:hypothetical protein BU14_0161s0025 [Porphyra umbilicalis]|uniref:Uncharacterized protein n=1 Tax=Porphyra umbilicalis TaxID=2786 RepID=A0A1X6P8Q0_PORUM|nr:hypothetical protein BU14_0161s0025 [Porphyra umbilicalis]|eukprot:OSX77105.1 hypothetical protein BU14_0161s0025 [Porphyra umbilicalis]